MKSAILESRFGHLISLKKKMARGSPCSSTQIAARFSLTVLNRRLILLWLLCRIPGKPRQCRVCDQMCQWAEHLIRCGQTPEIDSLVAGAQVDAAVRQLREAIAVTIGSMDGKSLFSRHEAKPPSSKSLVSCLPKAAEIFG